MKNVLLLVILLFTAMADGANFPKSLDLKGVRYIIGVIVPSNKEQCDVYLDSYEGVDNYIIKDNCKNAVKKIKELRKKELVYARRKFIYAEDEGMFFIKPINFNQKYMAKKNYSSCGIKVDSDYPHNKIGLSVKECKKLEKLADNLGV